MVAFSKLRLSGFKSFVEPTELFIEPGLTGVIGPNGCGKSNLVEALRWAMGETSPKSMRGSGMEDVIFAGTSSRPSRNMAEVTICLDNTMRDAPAAFNDADDLEITRRIERDAGSAYRINGGDVRARDVQLLFADSSTGAHSPALVSQGRVGALISAKPKDRRAILEEAAGITGLHSRRHEAELRLRAAEKNLVRLDDVMQQLDGQMQSLKRQARQASRYRNLQGHIRRAEALVLHLKWSEAKQSVEEARAKLKQAEQEVARTTEQASAASREQAMAQHELPPLREKEAECAAALHRLAVERDSLAQEEERARTQMRELEARIAQVKADLEREENLGSDATKAISRLSEEKSSLEAAQAAEKDTLLRAAEQVNEASQRVREEEERLGKLTQQAAELNAKRSGFDRAIREGEERLARVQNQLAEIEREQTNLTQNDAALQGAREAANRLAECEAALETANQAQSDAEEALAKARSAETETREKVNEARALAHKLKAEEQALTDLLATGTDGDFPPMVDKLEVAPGFETALGAALGDDLELPEDGDAGAYWTDLGPLDINQPLPDGIASLKTQVRGPDALGRRLSQVGVVENAAQGAVLQAKLKPGQRLVSRDGDLWRWDGVVHKADAPTAAAKRLAQRNRLADLKVERETADRIAAEATATHDTARETVQQATQAEQESRRARRGCDDRLADARRKQAHAEQEAAKRQNRLTALEESKQRLTGDRDEWQARVTEARTGLEGLDPAEALNAEIANLRQQTETLRTELAEAQSAHHGLKREAESRSNRLVSITDELRAWSSRQGNSARQIEALVNRRDESIKALEELQNMPEHLKAKRALLMDKIAQAEQTRRDAADKLAQAETRQAEADKNGKALQEAMGVAREQRARFAAMVEGGEERLNDSAARIREVLDVAPEKAIEMAELGENETPQPLGQLEDKLEKLKRERESMGAVNLRADEESRELQEQIDGMVNEREELETAIAKLRAGIASLNREGRERLRAAFDSVNTKFTDLFQRLFGGGTAHLEFVESDDPLAAGLEIFASPPGKKLQLMTLLSGGEQALTALALIFAVFLTNPSPICVLDEVDAPLDDANVERFTNLVESIADETGTRFLIITHHAVTMTKMHRLFGVTMAERGVSQLVSVNLTAAEELLAAE